MTENSSSASSKFDLSSLLTSLQQGTTAINNITQQMKLIFPST